MAISQSIKNSNSLLFKSVRLLKAEHRLTLTGTPIENSTIELWSLMDFLNPGLVGSRKEDVLKELPDKSEILLYSQMEKRQSDVYEQHRANYRETIAGAIERDGMQRAAIVIFSALLKLRQIALFPVLSDAKFKHVQSGGGKPGRGQTAPNRADKKGDCLQDDREEHGGGKDDVIGLFER